LPLNFPITLFIVSPRIALSDEVKIAGVKTATATTAKHAARHPQPGTASKQGATTAEPMPNRRRPAARRCPPGAPVLRFSGFRALRLE